MDCKDKFVLHCNDLPTQSYVFFKANRGKFCDVTLTTGGRSISAHRIILSAAIPRFCNIFRDEDEAPNSQEEVIDFPEVDPNALESLIDFAYTCQIEIHNENVKQLLSAASILHVEQVKKECISFLLNRLKPENVLSTRDYLCSKLSSSEELRKVDSYIRDNFEEVSNTADFANIPCDVLKGLIKNDNLKVESEERIFEIVMQWVKQCPEERKHQLPHLISKVRMPFIKPSYIRNNIIKEKLIRMSDECRDLADEALYYHIEPKVTEQHCSFVSRPRNVPRNVQDDVDGVSGIYVLGFQTEHMVQILNTKNTAWETRNTWCSNSEYLALTATELNKKIYIFFHEFTSVYDLERNRTSICKGMSLKRLYAGSVSHNNKLFVVGGVVSHGQQLIETSGAVECFDPNSQEWIHLTRMIQPRCGPGVVASAEFIYTLGGTDGDFRSFNSVERYNVRTGMWMMMPPMLTERCFQGCAFLNDKIYVCGGISCTEDCLSTSEVFDPVVNEWKLISSLSRAKGICKLVPFCGKLYCIGGETKFELPHLVEKYELEGNKWVLGPAISKRLPVVCVGVINMP